MDLLVTPEWVEERRKSGALVIVDATLPPVGVTPRVDTRARFVEKHIPGAVFFDIDALSDTETTLPHMLPLAAQFGAEMGRLGIADTDTIAVYEQEGVFSAPRAWWMLQVFGAKDVRVMQGGLRAWQAAGLPVEAGTTERPRATFHAVLDAEQVVYLEQLREELKSGAQVLDARSAGRFAGTVPEPRPGLSSGHMPGATSLPYTELVHDGKLKTGEELCGVFQEKGIALDRPVTTTCGSGVTAAVLALGLRLCGATQVHLYDGSWAEYAAQSDAVIEKG